jgi:hypothetical protein
VEAGGASCSTRNMRGTRLKVGFFLDRRQDWAILLATIVRQPWIGRDMVSGCKTDEQHRRGRVAGAGGQSSNRKGLGAPFFVCEGHEKGTDLFFVQA